MLVRKESHCTVLFTSAVSGEGKAFCAVAYARGLAGKGIATLLIDLDPDSSAMDRLLERGVSDRPGICQALTGGIGPDEVVQKLAPQLGFISAGGTLADLVEGCGRAGLSALLRTWQGRFERVVVSAPPVLGVNLSRMLASEMEAICLVSKTQKTRRRVLRRALHVLRDAGVPLRWIVLNRDKAVTVIGYRA
jgi:Mrp family chromosome partitioning ATPase